jgi:hypothetical protein
MKLFTERYPGGFVAYVDDGEGPCAMGPTEDLAVSDLLEVLQDDKQYDELVAQVRRERGL